MFELKHALWGTQYGDFNISHRSDNDSMKLLHKRKEREAIDVFFAPRCNFTNRIVKFGEENDEITDWLVRTKNYADGGIVEDIFQAVVFFNADCPIVVVRDLKKDNLAVLHAGFRCLMPEKKKGQRDRSIISVLFQDHGFEPKYSKVFFGYGIGPCCYGAENIDEVNPHYPTSDLSIGRVTRNWRRMGQRSIDLGMLIYKQLADSGVPEANISCDFTCTSCAGYSQPLYWSNARDVGLDSRNAAAAWLQIHTP